MSTFSKTFHNQPLFENIWYYCWDEIGEYDECPPDILCVAGKPTDDYYVADFKYGRLPAVFGYPVVTNVNNEEECYEFYVKDLHTLGLMTDGCDFLFVAVTKEEYNQTRREYTEFVQSLPSD
jgi:hypothetical protein